MTLNEFQKYKVLKALLKCRTPIKTNARMFGIPSNG